jgi:WD40 repeat protein
VAVSSLISIRLYETTNFQYLQTVGTGGAHMVAFSPDGATLAALTSTDLALYDLATGRSMFRMHTTGCPTGLAFSPDGKSIFTSARGDNGIHVWDVITGSLQQTLDIGEAATSLASNPDGTQFAVGNKLGTVVSWDTRHGFTPQIVQSGSKEPAGWVYSMAYSPNGEQLAVTHENEIRLYDAHTGLLIRSLSGDDLVFAVAYSPRDRFLAAGGDSGGEAAPIYLMDPDTGETLRTLQNPHGGVQTLRFSPDGSVLISLSSDQAVRFWDVASGSLLGALDGYTVSMFSIAFTPDGHHLFSGERLAALRMWDVKTQQPIATLVENSVTELPGSVYELAISPDGSLLASADARLITLWTLPTRERYLTLKGHEALVTGLVFTPDSKTLISSSWDGTIRLWDASTGAERKVVLGYTYAVSGVTLADGEEFVSAGDQTVRIWNWRTGAALGVLRREDIDLPFETLTDVKFCRQTKLVAIMDLHHVQLWDAAGDQWRKLHEFTGTGLEGMDFDPSGKLLAFGSDTGLVRVMDTGSGEILTTLDSGSDTNIFQISFSPDGRLLAVAIHNGEVQLWGIN